MSCLTLNSYRAIQQESLQTCHSLILKFSGSYQFLCPWDKMRNGPYLDSGAKNDKNKTTFPPQTFKDGEKESALILMCIGSYPDIWPVS